MKQKIIEKASEMFLELGFKSVTMDDLAHEMGISKKTIYSFFENKTDLITACTTYSFHNISDYMLGVCAQHKNPIAELYEVKKHMLAHLKGHRTAPYHQLQKYYPKIFKGLRKKIFDTMGHCVVENLNKGMAMDIYRSNLNVEFVSKIYFSGAESIKDVELFPPERFPMAETTDEFLEYHLRGIVTPKGRKILNDIINSNHE